MGVIYGIRWRLVYLDNRQLDEMPAGSPIADSWPNPVEMHLINLAGEAVTGIPIPPGHKPIFYRQRSITQAPSGEFGEAQLDATVFGYGRENGSKLDGKLWIWSRGGAIDCPQERVDRLAIELQMTA